MDLWCHANFAAYTHTRRSTTGWVATMYCGMVSWESQKQPKAAASTTDAEYLACGAVAKDALSLQKALSEFDVDMANTFNSLHWDAMFAAAQDSGPALLPMVQ